MHSTILASSTGWNWNLPTWTHSRAPLMVLAEMGDQREQEQDHPAGQQQVAVAVEVPRAADDGQGEDVGGHPPGGPCRLQGGVVVPLGQVDPEDHHVAEAVEQEGNGQDHRMGAWARRCGWRCGPPPRAPAWTAAGGHVVGRLCGVPVDHQGVGAMMITEAATSNPSSVRRRALKARRRVFDSGIQQGGGRHRRRAYRRPPR